MNKQGGKGSAPAGREGECTSREGRGVHQQGGKGNEQAGRDGGRMSREGEG